MEGQYTLRAINKHNEQKPREEDMDQIDEETIGYLELVETIGTDNRYNDSTDSEQEPYNMPLLYFRG